MRSLILQMTWRVLSNGYLQHSAGDILLLHHVLVAPTPNSYVLLKIHFLHLLYFLTFSDESDDKVEILFNSGDTDVKVETIRTDSGEKKVRKTKRGRQKKNGGNREQQEKWGAIASICSFWNVLTFSWMRPLMVIGTTINLFLQPCHHSDHSPLKHVSKPATHHFYQHSSYSHSRRSPTQNT